MTSSYEREKGDKFCTKHPKKELTFSCGDCANELVCGVCISTEHQGHKCTDLDLLAKEKYNFIENFKNEIQTEYTSPNIDNIIRNAEISVSQFEKCISADIDQVERQRQLLKKKVDAIADKNIADLKEMLKKYRTLLQQFQLTSENSKLRMQDLLIESKKALKSGENVLLIDEAKELQGIPTKPELFEDIPNVTFHKESKSDCKRLIKEAFGSIQILNVSESEDLIGAHALSVSEEIDARAIDASPSVLMKPILMETKKCPCNPSRMDVTKDGTICVISGSNVIHLLDIDGNSREIKVRSGRFASYEIYDIAVLPTSDTLYCVLDNANVILVDRHTGQTTVLHAVQTGNRGGGHHENMYREFDFNGYYAAYTLCFTRDGNMMVGARHKPLVNVYSPELKNMKTCSNWGNRGKIDKIRVCLSTGKIALVFSVSVLVLNRNFDKLYRYSGPRWQQINPSDAIFDQHGYLLVADSIENIGVHIVKAETGEHIQTITRDDMGRAKCLTIKNDGHVIVGISNPKRLLTFKYLE